MQAEGPAAPLTAAQLLLKQREDFRRAQEDIARLGSEVMENTEENVCGIGSEAVNIHVLTFKPDPW